MSFLVLTIFRLYSLQQAGDYIPERDDDELCVLCPVFDVVGNDRHVSEV